MWQKFWFFNQLAGLNLIQIPKKPDVSSQWPLYLRLFYLKRCHTHWETSMCTPISSIWASPNFFFHIYTWWSPITTLCYTVHTTTVFLSLFKMEIQEERKWKYLGKTQQPASTLTISYFSNVLCCKEFLYFICIIAMYPRTRSCWSL